MTKGPRRYRCCDGRPVSLGGGVNPVMSGLLTTCLKSHSAHHCSSSSKAARMVSNARSMVHGKPPILRICQAGPRFNREGFALASKLRIGGGSRRLLGPDRHSGRLRKAGGPELSKRQVSRSQSGATISAREGRTDQFPMGLTTWVRLLR